MARLRQRGLDLGLEPLLGHRALDALGDLAVAEEQERRDRHDLVLRRRLDVLVGVELDDLELGPLTGDLLDDRADHAAWTAPGRPEVDQDGLVRLDDLCLEVGVGDLVDAGHFAPFRVLTSKRIVRAARPRPPPPRPAGSRAPRRPSSRRSRPAARPTPGAGWRAATRPAGGRGRRAPGSRGGAG